MQDDSQDDLPPTVPNDVFARNADAHRRRAQTVERRGLEYLERGMLLSAIEALREAIETYQGLRDTSRAQSAEQYMALAMYEHGKIEEAVQIWEDLIARGWDRPTTSNFLVRHYEQLGDAQAVERVFRQLECSKREGAVFFQTSRVPKVKRALHRNGVAWRRCWWPTTTHPCVTCSARFSNTRVTT